jgi:hypothetical protein
MPPGARLLAGSVVGLDPRTAYEIRLTLPDPDGGRAERVLKARTMAEPAAPPALEEIRVCAWACKRESTSRKSERRILS